jgi:hypothetical protein
MFFHTEMLKIQSKWQDRYHKAMMREYLSDTITGPEIFKETSVVEAFMDE